MYDPSLGRWHVPDPLAEMSPDLTPYRYGFNNPIRYFDIAGLYEGEEGSFTPDDDDWADVLAYWGVGSNTSDEGDEDEGDKDKKKKTTASAMMEIMSYAPRSETNIGFSVNPNTDFSGLATSLDDFYNSFSADVTGIILSGNGFFAGGMGLNFAVVSVAGDGIYLLINVRGGMGGDVSASIGYIIGNSSRTTPTGESLRGASLSESLGALGISETYWADYQPESGLSGLNWTGVATQFTLGSKTVVGGNLSFGQSYPIKLKDYGNN